VPRKTREKPAPLLARDWLERARQHLIMARQAPIQSVSFAIPAFHTQQSAELALKAVCHHRHLDYERTHDIRVLASELEARGVPVTSGVKAAASLSRYAVQTRYPGRAPPVTQAEYEEAIRLAQTVLEWAEGIIK
jgi:HEPN domain-containing protein